MTSARNVEKCATEDDVRHTLGELNADTISGILATDTPPELVQVREWLDADPIIRAQLHRGATGRVAAVCDMVADEDSSDSDER